MVKKIAFSLSVYFVLVSCAASYKPILPAQLTYGNSSSAEGLDYAYRYNVLTETKNRKYAKKEIKKNVRLVAIQVQNNTGEEISIREDVRFYMGDRLVLPLDVEQTHQSLKQIGALYLLYSFLWLTFTSCDGVDCTTIPIPLGLVIGLGNLGMASSANKTFLTELIGNNILNRTLKPGETATGLIGISSDQFNPLEIRMSR